MSKLPSSPRKRGSNPDSRLRGNDRRGFSLMELMIAATLIPLISFAVFGTFSSATKLWKILAKPDPYEDLDIFSQKTRRDLEQSFRYTYKGTEFSGNPVQFEIPTLIETDPSVGGNLAVGQAVYAFDERKRAILRETRSVSDLLAEKPGAAAIIRPDVDSCQMSYLVWRKDEKKFEWREEVKKEENLMPAAIRFRFTAPFDGVSKEITRTFLVPAGD